VLEAFKDEVHEGCDRFSDRRSEGRGENRNTVGLVGITQANESVKGEGRIPDPRSTIIPVSLSADEFWEGERRTSYNGPGRFINEQF